MSPQDPSDYEEDQDRLKDLKRRRMRPVALIIKAGDEGGHADVFKSIRANVKPSELGVDVKGIRKTRADDVLVEVEASADKKVKFGSALSADVGPASTVRSLSPEALVEIKDLDAATVEAEIRSALNAFFGAKTDTDFKISLSREIKW